LVVTVAENGHETVIANGEYGEHDTRFRLPSPTVFSGAESRPVCSCARTGAQVRLRWLVGRSTRHDRPMLVSPSAGIHRASCEVEEAVVRVERSVDRLELAKTVLSHGLFPCRNFSRRCRNAAGKTLQSRNYQETIKDLAAWVLWEFFAGTLAHRDRRPSMSIARTPVLRLVPNRAQESSVLRRARRQYLLRCMDPRHSGNPG